MASICLGLNVLRRLLFVIEWTLQKNDANVPAITIVEAADSHHLANRQFIHAALFLHLNYLSQTIQES